MSPFTEHGGEEAVKPSEGRDLLWSQGTCDPGVSLASLPTPARIAVAGTPPVAPGTSQRGARGSQGPPARSPPGTESRVLGQPRQQGQALRAGQPRGLLPPLGTIPFPKKSSFSSVFSPFLRSGGPLYAQICYFEALCIVLRFQSHGQQPKTTYFSDSL